MADPLATLDDFFGGYGLPAAACVPQPRPIESVNATTNRILARGHGLISGDRLKLSGQGTLPTPATRDAIYEALVVDHDLFSLVHTEGASVGQTVDLTTAGALPITYLVDPRPAIERELAAASSLVRDHLTGHSEVETAPEIVLRVVCTLAAWNLAYTRGLLAPNALEAIRDALQKRYDDAQTQLARWLRGRPVAGLVDATPSTAENGARARAVGSSDAWSGWGPGL